MTELPNRFSPLAFLPPALASQFEVSRYVFAATLGAYVWDIALNLGNDYTLLFKHRTSTAMLFFLRVTAVWHSSKIAYVVFSILWLAVLGAGITNPVVLRGAHIGPTKQCIDTVVPGSIEASAIMPLINDTAIFFAINYRILAHIMVADSSMARLRVFFGGPGLSALSQALLQSGQHFYLIAVAAHIIFLVVLKVPQLTPAYHAMLSVPGLALVNAMARLVFRRIKFGLINSDGTSKLPTINLPSDFHATANPKSLPLYFHRTDATTSDLERNTTFPLEVHSQKETHGVGDGADAGQEIPKNIYSA
ncbi:hypothetical protein C8R45DRAFT_930245 [Mycena sanguinolenta]|nr:hypothetical protein C8R45DRAFT_930245 [Mycena sanguinolenta]